MTSQQSPESLSVLVVDDEPSFRKAMRASLAANGFVVEEAGSGKDALAKIRQRPYEIVLLDVKMPGVNGVDACQQIRAISPRIGIVMVTVSDSEEDRMRALEAGADDYVTKPLRVRELVARLGAVRRRTHVARDAESDLLQAGDLKLELERRLLWRRGARIPLSPVEFDLLAYLMKNTGAPITHARLLGAVWGPEYGGEVEYLRTYILMLQKKIEDDPERPEYVLTEPLVGYRFRNPSDQNQPANHPEGE